MNKYKTLLLLLLFKISTSVHSSSITSMATLFELNRVFQRMIKYVMERLLYIHDFPGSVQSGFMLKRNGGTCHVRWRGPIRFQYEMFRPIRFVHVFGCIVVVYYWVRQRVFVSVFFSFYILPLRLWPFLIGYFCIVGQAQT